jgi:hypothetical protein
MTTKTFANSNDERILLEMTSHHEEVVEIRLFDGSRWHVAPLHEWGVDDQWESKFDRWHNAIVENA